MAVVAVKSNTGSTIAIIIAIFAALGIGYLVVRNFKFPDFNFPDLNFPDLDFLNPFKTTVPLGNVPPLDVVPQGFGLEGESALQRAYNLIFASGSRIERSFGTRPIAPSGSVAGIRGFPLASRAIARRTPTFFGSITTAVGGTRAIAGSQALFDRLLRNLRVSSNAQASELQKRSAVQQSGSGGLAGFINPVLSRSGRCIRNCTSRSGFNFGGVKIGPSSSERKFNESRRQFGIARGLRRAGFRGPIPKQVFLKGIF